MSKFNLDSSSRKVVIVVLLLGLIFNILTFFYFRYSTQKKLDIAISSINDGSARLYNDVLIRVDDYMHVFSTNILNAVLYTVGSNNSNSVSSFSSSSLDYKLKDDSPLLPVVDTIDYYYFSSGGKDYARIRNQDFTEGSFYPRGGIITRVYADCIILDDRFRVSRAGSSSSFKIKDTFNSVTSSPSPQKFDFSDSINKLKGLTHDT